MSSHGEIQSLAQFWKDVPVADTEAREWLNGPRVTFDDLLRGSARIVRCTAAQWWSAAKQQGEPQAQPARGGRGGPLLFNWGNKHRGKLAVDVREEDPGYWRWSLTLDWWRAKVETAGLLDEDDEAA